MDPFWADWLNLLIRWGHLIAGISWIGTSFYFVALDFSLRKHATLPPGVAGEAWEVHGGGFYHVQKYLVAPAQMPDHLIWFKWEAYLTWVTGFLLLIVQYYLNASSFLIDPAKAELLPWQAVALSIGGLAVGWLVYDVLCRSPLNKHTGPLAFLVFAFVLAAAYFYTHIFSGRGAFIQIGALVGTMMAANVFMVIIPNQRKSAAALMRGEKPDPRFGVTGKQRSLHNTYFTLPVLVMMVSNHYAFLTENRHAWLIIGLIIIGGAMLRYFLLRTELGDDQKQFAWALPGIACVLVGAMMLTEPPKRVAFAGTVTDDEVVTIMQSRCAACHSAQPTDPTIKSAPKGVMLVTIDDVKRHAAQINAQAVFNKAMPLGNKTKMTDEERAKLGAWIAAQ